MPRRRQDSPGSEKNIFEGPDNPLKKQLRTMTMPPYMRQAIMGSNEDVSQLGRRNAQPAGGEAETGGDERAAPGSCAGGSDAHDDGVVSVTPNSARSSNEASSHACSATPTKEPGLVEAHQTRAYGSTLLSAPESSPKEAVTPTSSGSSYDGCETPPTNDGIRTYDDCDRLLAVEVEASNVAVAKTNEPRKTTEHVQTSVRAEVLWLGGSRPPGPSNFAGGITSTRFTTRENSPHR
jgi:hypothetical protein